MKLISIFTFLLLSTVGFSQSLPFDFEGGDGSVTFVDFDGGTATIEANPLSAGENTSAFVAKIVRDGGAAWSGSKVSLAVPLDFSEMNSISMKVYTTAPVGTPVNFKLEQPGVTDAQLAVPTTVTGEWEILTWNFSGQPPVFTDLVFMFDLGTVGDGSETSTFYFDDVSQTITEGSLLEQIDVPVDFEGELVDYTVTDFGGTASTLVADPEDAGNSVIQTVKTVDAATWAGTTIGTDDGFATLLPFTLEDSRMSVRVWSPTAGTPIRLKVEDSNDNTHTCETEAMTTMAGAWEVLEFDFANEAAGTAQLSFGLDNGWVYNKASIFFNFDTSGMDAGEQTYYFDDVLFVGGGGTGLLDQIDLPVDFEGMTTDYTVIDFGGNSSTLVEDPTDAGNMVIQSIKTENAEVWAGTTIGTNNGFATDIPLALTDSKMNIRVWSPTAGTPIRLKVEDANDNTHTCETEALTTMAGAWEVLEFDFVNQSEGTATLAEGLLNGWIYNKASIFFDFDTNGGATPTTYYFDDVKFGPADNTPELDQIDLPVTFEGTTTDYSVTDFGGNASTLVEDPTDATNMVMESVKTAGSEVWAGTTIGTPAGFASDIPFTLTESRMNVRVWSPTAGTPIRLKVEDAADNTHTCETEVMTTVEGDWEVLEFDFNDEAEGTPTLAFGLGEGWTFNMASIFFNFGTSGTDEAYYFDDVMFGATDNINDVELTNLLAYPNPTEGAWTISAEKSTILSVTVYDLTGKHISTIEGLTAKVTVDATLLDSGIYTATVVTNEGAGTIRLVKQ